ncbi:hypothetical protein IV49_GL001352 [Kandleria vitulina DSM 20405]|uniref:Uncharacterized protein n=2 Tax=Kandleria vitulina TaxID=1630 RepID=A0A0R2HCT5_9FIRM|nr:hypothetical protein IV49_GL001352 [Kandleria vitulina DSM 20405]
MEKMDSQNNHKYMNMFTMIGYFLAIILIIALIFTRKIELLLPIAIVIIACRLIGYSIDHFIEYKNSEN